MLSGKQFSIDDFRARFDNRNANVCGIHIVGKGSWKGQLQVLSWKVRNEIGTNEVGKLKQKLESITEV